MDDENARARRPAGREEASAAPEWFANALKLAPSRTLTQVHGAGIETLTWGVRGRPGLLFLHGNGAHADWWSFIAPFFAEHHRVAAMSWSGMGRSDWRPHYSLDLYVEEAFLVAQAAGLFEADTKPVFIGHSFGGFPLVGCAARRGGDLRAAVVVDSPFLPPERLKEHRERQLKRSYPGPTRIYPSRAAGLARFRLLPPQPPENLFIIEHIAQMSLKKLGGNGAEGWAWCFDPLLWRRYRMTSPVRDLAAVKCPIAIIRGARSIVMTQESALFTRGLSPSPLGTPLVEIPEAHHHLMIDQPLAFISALRALLAGWTADAPRAPEP
jgi:pimeloyl-ACP methyl ester carboxylesterase